MWQSANSCSATGDVSRSRLFREEYGFLRVRSERALPGRSEIVPRSSRALRRASFGCSSSSARLDMAFRLLLVSLDVLLRLSAFGFVSRDSRAISNSFISASSFFSSCAKASALRP